MPASTDTNPQAPTTAVDLPTTVKLTPPALPGIPQWIPPIDTGIPPATDINELSEFRHYSIAAENTAIPTCYGRDRFYGAIFVLHVDDSAGFLYVAYAFCKGEIESFETIYVDGVDINAAGGFLSFSGAASETHVGTTAQSASTLLSAAITGFSDTYPDLAYLVLKVPPESTQGFPRVEAIIQGKKIFDLRKYNAIYDENADPQFDNVADTAEATAQWFSADDESATMGDDGWTNVSDASPANTTVAELVNNNDDSQDVFSKAIPVDVTKDYTVHVYARQPSGDRRNYLVVSFYDDNDLIINNGSTPVSDATGWDSVGAFHYWGISNATFPSGWTEYVFDFGPSAGADATIPTGAVTMRVGGRFVRDGASGTNTTVRISDYRVFEGLQEVEQDPDDNTTWEYNKNPSLCFADFVSTFTDWELTESDLAVNANHNDELLSGVPRRELGLTLLKPALIQKWVTVFRVYCGCYLTWEAGKIRMVTEKADVDITGGAVFNGTNNHYIDMGDQAELDFSTVDFTVEAWFNSAATTQNRTVVAKKTSLAAAGDGYSIYLDSSGNILATVADGTTVVTSTYTGTFDDNDWHHVALVVDRTADTMLIVADGVDNPGGTDSVSALGNIDSSEEFRIGSDNSGDVFIGTIDEVRVWDDVRTNTEINDNMFAEIPDPQLDSSLVGYWKCNEGVGGTATDFSLSGNDGTLSGAVAFGLGNTEVIPEGVVRHFTADDINQRGFQLKRKSTRSFPTEVQVEYTDSSGSKWPVARQKATESGVLTGATPKRISKVSLPGIHNASQAKRVAIERLNWFLSDLECTLPVFDVGLEVQQGSVVAVTHPIGLTAKLFRVRGLTGLSGRWVLDLTEYDPAIYSNEVISDPTFPDTQLGDPLNPPLVTSLTAVEELYTTKDGSTGSRIRVNWDASNYPFLSQYRVEGLVDGAVVWQTLVVTNEAVSPGVEQLVANEPVPYNINVSILSGFSTGTAANAEVLVQGKLAPPSDVPSITATVVGAGEIDVTWGAAVDIDIWKYEIRLGSQSDTWETATFVDLIEGQERTLMRTAVGSYRVFVKAIDSVRNESVNAITADFTISAPPAVTSVSGFEIGGEVRLSWAQVDSGYPQRYRIAYSDIPETFETTLDIVDTLRFQSKDVPEGNYTFKVYTQNTLGVEAATPATIDIIVTSDTDTFLIDSYEFVTPTLTNMTEWQTREYPNDNVKYYTTDMGEPFDSGAAPHDFVAGTALANYHTSGASEWLSETKDFSVSLTGDWSVALTVTSLLGTIYSQLELSTDAASWDNFNALSARGTYRYARVRIFTTVNEGTSTSFVITPGITLNIKVVPLTESGSSTSLTSGGDTVELDRTYAFVTQVNAQPKNTQSPLSAVIDNVQIGESTGISSIGIDYLTKSSETALNFGTGDFSIEFWAPSSGTYDNTTWLWLVSKRTPTSGAGWSIEAQGFGRQFRMVVDDGTNEVTSGTTVAFPVPDAGVPKTWAHFAFTVDRTGDNLRIYKNGVEQVGSPYDISTVTGSLNNSNALALFADDAGNKECDWEIDEVRIWNDLRTAGEILTNYNTQIDIASAGLVAYYRMDSDVGEVGSTVIDSTSNGYDLTKIGSTSEALMYIENSSPLFGAPKKINSFDVYILDIFGQQIAADYQWDWKGV